MKARLPVNGRATGAAFTLLELMVAIALFMLILTGIYSSWMAVVRSARVGLEAAAVAQRARIAVNAVEEAVATTEMYSANAQLYSFVAENLGDFSYLELTARLPSTFPGAGMFPPEFARRVTFVVEEGKTYDERNLMLYQRHLLQETNAMVQPYAITLARNIHFFLLEFWDHQRGEWVEEYVTTNQLPAAVRVHLAFKTPVKNAPDHVDLFSRIIALPGTVVTPEMQGVQAGGRPGQQGR